MLSFHLVQSPSNCVNDGAGTGDTELDCSDTVSALEGLVAPQEEDCQKNQQERKTVPLRKTNMPATPAPLGSWELLPVTLPDNQRTKFLCIPEDGNQSQCFTRSMFLHRGQSNEHKPFLTS